MKKSLLLLSILFLSSGSLLAKPEKFSDATVENDLKQTLATAKEVSTTLDTSITTLQEYAAANTENVAAAKAERALVIQLKNELDGLKTKSDNISKEIKDNY